MFTQSLKETFLSLLATFCIPTKRCLGHGISCYSLSLKIYRILSVSGNSLANESILRDMKNIRKKKVEEKNTFCHQYCRNFLVSTSIFSRALFHNFVCPFFHSCEKYLIDCGSPQIALLCRRRSTLLIIILRRVTIHEIDSASRCLLCDTIDFRTEWIHDDLFGAFDFSSAKWTPTASFRILKHFHIPSMMNPNGNLSI